MIFEAVRSEGTPNLSYVIGDSGKVAVIDPRRDCRVYLDIAHRAGARITHIFETHCGEDYLSGSRELSLHTAAPILHGGQIAFLFGNPVFEGEEFNLGSVRLGIMETPGHTPESISIALTDRGRNDHPFAVFTGDTLLAGETAWIDLPGSNPKENAEHLYDSIFNRLLPLGDLVIVYPARGMSPVAGRFGGTRDITTLGYERQNNPQLRNEGRDAFIERKTREHHSFPSSLILLSRSNREGPPLLNGYPVPQPHSAKDFADAMDAGMFVLDLRNPEAVSGAHIPGSLALPLSLLPAYAGWLIPYDRAIGLVTDSYVQAETAVRYLIRAGFDSIPACLVNGLSDWDASGNMLNRFPLTHLPEIHRRFGAERFLLLDVRSPGEYSEAHLPESRNIPLEELSGHEREIAGNIPIVCFSEQGMRAAIAASLLRLNGFDRVEAGMGSLAASAVFDREPILTETV